VAVIAVGTLIVLRITRSSIQSKALHQALAYVDEKPSKLSAGQLAIAHQLAGSYLLKENKLDEAKKQFGEARTQIGQADPSAQNASDLAVISLAGDQVGLGGDKAEVDRQARMKWDDAEKQLLQTLHHLKTADGKRIAVRLLTRQLTARGQGTHG